MHIKVGAHYKDDDNNISNVLTTVKDIERSKTKEFIADDIISNLTFKQFSTRPTFVAALASGWSINLTTIIDFT